MSGCASNQSNGSIEVVGSGIAGLCAALVFAERGCQVRVVSASDGPDADCCSWWAGGMLAPWCEMESAEPLIETLGIESMKFWRKFEPSPARNGTLVLANARDFPDLRRFSRRTTNWSWLDGSTVSKLEPDLAGRFTRGLFFAEEAHFDPREVLYALVGRLKALGVELQFGQALSATDLSQDPKNAHWRIDCRGLAARDALRDLRGVKGEMLIIESREVRLCRPIRLLHPRFPLYIVPRGNGQYMLGATMIESAERERATVRSVLELLSAAYAVHPSFGEAQILEIGVDARPAFPDNVPQLRRNGRTIYINGLYRHGYLAAPALARQAADMALQDKSSHEIGDENHGEWRAA